jgi:shikimate kinase
VKRRHVVLVGLPGSGKSTVGRLVALRLGAPFADFDQLIEERAGKPIPRIFAEDGEAAFRQHEATIGAEQLAGAPSVLSPGGGYLQDPVQRRLALNLGYLVYLMTSPSVAARRLDDSPERPLLKGFEPTLRLHQLLEQRGAAYLESQGRVTTDQLTPQAVADEVAQLARTHGGW